MEVLTMKKPSKSNERHKDEINVTVWLKPEIVAAIKMICIKEGRTRPMVIKRALAAYAKARGHDWPERDMEIDLD